MSVLVYRYQYIQRKKEGVLQLASIKTIMNNSALFAKRLETNMAITKVIVILTVVLNLAINVSANRCKIDEYYQTVLEQCHPCSAICDPITSRECVNKCGGYIKEMEKNAVQPESTTSGFTITRMPIALIVVVAVLSTFLLICIGGLVYYFRKSIAELHCRLMQKHQDKPPIQEMGPIDPSRQALV